MNPAIKSASTAIRRAILWFQLFAITTHIDGQTKLIDWMQDAGGDRRTIGNMLIARHHAVVSAIGIGQQDLSITLTTR